MRAYCVEYTLAGDSTIHRTKIYAPSAKDALTKLADGFGSDLKEFNIQSNDESRDDSALAEFLHGETAPTAHSFWHHRQAAVAASSKLIEERVEPT
jgi:hypothetical protein